MVRFLCARYGGPDCPMRGTDGMIYDVCPLCEDRADAGATGSGDELRE
jgi:hypothetical protein